MCRFDLSNEEVLAHYVSLLKAIALRLDEHTVQFFISEAERTNEQKLSQQQNVSPLAAALSPQQSAVALSTAPLGTSAVVLEPTGNDAQSCRLRGLRSVINFPLFDMAMNLWSNDERMVRTAVRTIILSICRVNDSAVRAFISRSPALPRQLNASLRSGAAALTHAIRGASVESASASLTTATTTAAMAASDNTARGGAFAPCDSQLGAMEGCLQLVLDDIYFVNDLLEANVEPLSSRIIASLLSQFLMPYIVNPLSEAHATSKTGKRQPNDPYPRLVGCLLLCHSLHIFSSPQLLSALTTLLLHPRLCLTDVKLTKLDLLPSHALVEARVQVEHSLTQSAVASPWLAADCPHPATAVLLSPAMHISPPELHSSCRGGLALAAVEAVYHHAIDTGNAVSSGGVGGVVIPIADDGPDRNALRAAALAMLGMHDERFVFLGCCSLLAAIRCVARPSLTAEATSPPGHEALLRQAGLLPLRMLRSESKLTTLLRTHSSGVAAANISLSDFKYCDEAVTNLLGVLKRAAKQPMVSDDKISNVAGEPESSVRLVTVQSAVELLFELLHDTSTIPNLAPHHAAALEAAHTAAAARLRRTLHGRFAASLGNLLEYEGRQLPLPLGPSFRLTSLAGDCTLLLPAEALAGVCAVPLARRKPRDELEATRACIQVFLLVRHARNTLLHVSEDVRTLARPPTKPLPPDMLIDIPASAPLLPCSLLVNGQQPISCRLLLYPSSHAPPPHPSQSAPTAITDPAHHGYLPARDAIDAARSYLILVKRPQSPLHFATAGAAPAVSSAESSAVATLTASGTARPASPSQTTHASVVLCIPLSALTLTIATGGTRLICRVPRHHVPPFTNAEHPMQLEFDEPWRCSAAKSQVEAVCIASRAEQHKRLLGVLAASPS